MEKVIGRGLPFYGKDGRPEIDNSALIPALRFVTSEEDKRAIAYGCYDDGGDSVRGEGDSTDW